MYRPPAVGAALLALSLLHGWGKKKKISGDLDTELSFPSIINNHTYSSSYMYCYLLTVLHQFACVSFSFLL